MGFPVVPAEEVVVVGGDDVEAGASGDFEELGEHRDLGGVVMVLEFDEEAVPAEDVLVLSGDGDGGFHVAFFEHGGDFRAEVAVDDDEAFGVFGEGFLIDAGAVVEALGEGEAGELEQVFPAGEILDDDGEVVGGLGDAVGVFLEAGAGGDVHFAAEDGLDGGLVAGFVKFDGAEEVAVVGEAQGGHGEVLGGADEVVDGGGAVEEGVVGVAVKMDERGAGGVFRHGGGFLRDGRDYNEGRAGLTNGVG